MAKDFFADERANELRNLFFESAQELLQALNEEGLLMEKAPSDPEIVRNIRRTVHTLKGDSAACGYKEMSDLSHALEDVLTPEISKKSGAKLAELVLSAADTFEAMLGAYKNKKKLPPSDGLRKLIDKVMRPAEPVSKKAASKLAPKFAWTEYEQLLIGQSAVRGQHVYNVALKLDPQNPMRDAALQLIRTTMQTLGTVLVMRPDESTPPKDIDIIEAAICTHHEKDWVKKKCKIPAVVSQIQVEEAEVAKTPSATVADVPAATEPESRPRTLDAEEPDLLGLLTDPAADPVVSKSTPAAVPSATENILRVDAERIDNVLDLVGELIIGKSMLLQTLSEFTRRFPKDPLRNRFVDAMAFQQQVLNKLQRSVMKIRMVPVDQLFRRFPRIVRDVSKAQNKDVRLLVEGETTDLDKSILDALAEPLTHLVRNAVDHGIESPEERRTQDKPVQGTIKLNAYHQGNQVVIEVSDNGRGIDIERVVAKAVANGAITKDDAERLPEQDKLNLVFMPGLSTAETVTDISGRGVGMDIVKACMERLKGTVSIQTELGIGTTFRLKLPLTLAIIKALLFRVGERLYAIPLTSVLEITRAVDGDIHLVDKHEVMNLRDEVLTLVRLRSIGHGPSHGKKGKSFIVVVTVGERKFGLIVDQLVGEEELVIKALDDNLVSTEMASGASILGDGTVVLILNLSAVVERVGRAAAGRKAAGAMA